MMNRRDFLAMSAAGALAGALPRRARAAERKKYKAVIIGDFERGGYGHHLHLAFALRDDVAVVGLSDPHEAARERFGSEAGAERRYADYRDMLERESPDLAVIAPRWSVDHKEQLLACVEAGAHGFMEKPMCVDLEEADAMVAAASAKNLKWNIAFNMRVSPLMEHTRKLVVDDGLIGTLVEARGRGKEDARAGGEDLIVLGVHIFDMMRYFMGNPAWCAADVTHNGRPALPEHVREASEPLGPVVGNRLHAMYGFPQGTAGHFSSMLTREGDGGRWGLDLFGTKGVVSIRAEYLPDIRWRGASDWVGAEEAWRPLPDMPEYTIADQSTERHKPLIDDLIDAIEKDRAPAASLEDGRAAHEMIQAVWASHVSGGGKVSIPLAQRAHPLRDWS